MSSDKARYSPEAWARKLMRNASKKRLARRAARVGKPLLGHGFKEEPVSPRPPREVLEERDFRYELPAEWGCPPTKYAGRPGYYVMAWRVQRRFLMGQRV